MEQRLRPILTALLLCLLCSSGFAQSGADLQGNWLINWNMMAGAMTSSEQQNFNALSDEAKSRVQSSFTSRQFKLNDNGQAEVTWQTSNGQRTESGTWNLSGEVLTMIISGQEGNYRVALSGNQLTLIIQNPLPGALFSKLILVKQ
jgi:hypothetical protein